MAAVARREQPGLILMGKQAIDDNANQTPQMLVALLNWPQATFARRLAQLAAAAGWVGGTLIGLEQISTVAGKEPWT